MPRGDKTGPQGKGPGTGRGKGRCGGKGSQRPGGQPRQGQGLAREKVKAAKAVSAEEETNKDKNFFKKGE